MKLALHLLLGLTLLCGAQASTLITESFSTAGTNGVTPDGWTPTNPAAVSIVSLAGVNYQRILRNNSEGGSSAIYYTGSQGEVTDGQILDFEASVFVRLGGTFPQNQTLRGVVFRTQDTTLSAPDSVPFWGYSVGFIPTGEQQGLYLYENPTGATSSTYGTLRAQASLADPLSANTVYLLKITAAQSTITASLWSGDGATELASISYDQAVIQAGYFGLRSAQANSVANTAYRDLTLNVTAIPEPALLGLLGTGLFFLIRFAR